LRSGYEVGRAGRENAKIYEDIKEEHQKSMKRRHIETTTTNNNNKKGKNKASRKANLLSTF